MDTACMFLISALMIVSCHHGWSVTKNDKDLFSTLVSKDVKLQSNDYVYRYVTNKDRDTKKARGLIPASKLFLFFMCPLLVFNYIGSILDMNDVAKNNSAYEGLDSTLKWIFGPLQLLWMVALVMWVLSNNGLKPKTKW